MSATQESPRFMRSNTLNHLVESNISSSREAIRVDLIDKIVYDDPAVFRRLRVDEVDNNFVATCTASLKAENAADIRLLKDLVAQASGKSPQVLDAEETSDRASDSNKEQKSGNHGSAEEKKMYDPLVRLFAHIANFDQATVTRRFLRTNGMLKADERHTFGFPSVSPDITVSQEGEDASNSRKWRHRDAFGEVKPSKSQGPKPANAGTIPGIVTQCTDYARLFMSARPFMLFCVGVLIFGTEFCVGIFDRDGVTFSPIYDMFEDAETLVRVVRSISCDLSIQELGLDPTVHVLTDEETMKLTGSTKYPSYPSAVVSSIGKDPRRWCTIGPPVWTSLSFLGRGTNVWRVREYVEGLDQQPRLQRNVMIMKTAWRSSARISESDIYLSIGQPTPKGLAEFECGGDVKFDGYAGHPITVQNLRSEVHKFLTEGDINLPTPVLHRLILRTVGRSMWEYKSERDLLTGFRDSLQAHKNLYERGILHRDISAGNVLLTETPNVEPRGFITDLEFAHIKSLTIRQPQVTVETIVSPQTRYDDRGKLLSVTEATIRTHTTFETTVMVKRGAGMTGTAQFMALDLLSQKRGKPIAHEATHDVQSFIWVLSYCVLRHLFHRASHQTEPKEIRDQCLALRKMFHEAFGQTTSRKIASQRQSRSVALIFPEDDLVDKIITKFMSDALVNLFKNLQGLMHCAIDPISSTPLTHDALLVLVNNTIEALP